MGRIFSRIIFALGSLLLLYSGVFYTQDLIKMTRWIDTGRDGYAVRSVVPDSLWVFTRIDEQGFPRAEMRPVAGDTLLTLITSAGDSLTVAEVDSCHYLPGEAVRMIYRHEGQIREARQVYYERTSGAILYTAAMQITRILVTLGFLIVGLWALGKQPDLGGVRALALFSFAMSSFMISGVGLEFNNLPAFAIPGDRIIQSILEILAVSFGIFWLNLHLYFPSPFDWIRRHPLLTYLLLYLPHFGLYTIFALGVEIGGGLMTILITLEVSGGFLVLSRRLIRTREPLARRQLSLVTWGSGIGLGLLFLLVILQAVIGLTARLPGSVMNALVLITFLGLLLSPLSFAFAFGRYRLLEVEGRLQRGTRYVLVTGVLLLVFFGLLYFSSGYLLKRLDLSGRAPTLAVALIMALGFTPLHRRTQTAFANRIYPERKRLVGILRGFHETLATMTDRDSLFASLENSLREGIGIKALVPAILDTETGVYMLPGTELPFGQESRLMETLREKRSPLLVDELWASEKIPLSPVEREWLASRKVGVILPLTLRSRLSGLLFLICDREWEGLGVAGMEELRSLGTRVALECENLQLLETTLDKKRLEEQLEMARRVQEGFLPGSLPETPGLELAACFRSCLEVAGDYYDVVTMPRERTLIAVGDVSGKGAGAAMIMANLQASIRSMTRVNVPLGEMVEGINDIIHANTPVGQFITFFAAVFDPLEGRLTFVNAGHNPPRIIHRDGTSTELGPVGPILGVFPGLEYGEQSIVLAEGELIVAFTDGVSEVMNADDDDFGEDRIVEALVPNLSSPPDQLLTVIEEAVDSWRGECELGDDYTLLIGRLTDKRSTATG